MANLIELGPLNIGSSELSGYEDRIISESPYVKLWSNPVWDGVQWRAVAEVGGMLCIIAVKLRPPVPSQHDLAETYDRTTKSTVA